MFSLSLRCDSANHILQTTVKQKHAVVTRTIEEWRKAEEGKPEEIGYSNDNFAIKYGWPYSCEIYFIQ